MFSSDGTQVASNAANYIEDVFSTYLYTGNNGASNNVIANGIDLSTKGGLTWIKNRTSAVDHFLFDTARGMSFAVQSPFLSSNLTNAQSTTLTNYICADTTGFTLGTSATGSGVNASANNYASWTFLKQPKFFDVVTYTGTGSARTVAHNLGSVPGCIIIKRTDTTGSWIVYHQGLPTPQTNGLILNADTAQQGPGVTGYWNSTLPTSTVFTVNTNASLNASGGTYVAYLYAHNAGGFGLTGTDNVISCGTYTGTGAAGNVITTGYETQWVLVKNASTSLTNWNITDVMRGMSQSPTAYLSANTSSAEGVYGSAQIIPTATGFQIDSTNATYNQAGDTYIYIAIRRGPMKVPTDATKVFYPSVATGSGTAVTTGFPVDLNMAAYRAGDSGNFNFVDRLRGNPQTSTDTANNKWLISSSTAAETTTTVVTYQWWNTGYNIGPYGETLFYSLRRAPGFFDEVCYTGTGANLTQNHNLGVAPELTIIKSRSDVAGWVVGTNFGASTFTYGVLQATSPMSTQSYPLVYTAAPTATQLSLGTTATVNTSGSTYVAYLFATCAGVSKVGSYTGTGVAQTINCGFTAGARFVLIKRTDAVGDWYVWDTARGIVSGNDPYLLLNSTAAEVTITDYISPQSSGFGITTTAATTINVLNGTYIFLAIA